MEAMYEFERLFRDQVTQCSRCGYCQAVCPVYGATLRPALNARGKMLLLKEVMDGKIHLDDGLVDSLYQCTTCGSCVTICPSGVRVPDIIKQARRDMVRMGFCHPAAMGMHDVLRSHTNIYGEDEPADFGREKNKRAAYVYFIGCVGSYREDDATMGALGLLERLRVDYTLIDEVCCSGVLEDVGYGVHGDLAGKNVERILATGAGTVITGCPYCFRTFNDNTQYRGLGEKGVKVIHLAQFLKDFDPGVTTEKQVTFHDPCNLGKHCGIYEEPRETIRKIAPNFIEMPHHHADSLCCGAGGGVRGTYDKSCTAMARRRLEEAEAVGAEVILTECASCVQNLSNAKLRTHKFKIYNTAQFIYNLMEHGDN